jgi:hypothetical protein
VEEQTGGEPTDRRKYVRCSLRYLATKLKKISHSTVQRLLKKMGFSLRVNVKRFTGPPHPDRDKQFCHLQQKRKQFQKSGNPIISVDTKKKELIGNFQNKGRCWSEQADEVNVYDFPSDAECRAAPYGIYDPQTNQGHVCVGTNADTSKFAVNSIRHWWKQKGKHDYPQAAKLLIQADSGGSNGCRPRLWKSELQQFANETGLAITVTHFPRGGSKWNSIEHKMFAAISGNWSGKPLRSLPFMLQCIRGTTTKTGLRITANCDRRKYRKGIKVSDAEMKLLNITHSTICPQWNYTIKPNLSN